MAALFLANESVGTDDAFPSTFELIMQERMASGFKPAAQYFLTAICDAYPHVASTLPVRHFHETYALVRLGIERYCLSNYDCMLVERFYGIKRMELTDTVDIGGKTASQLKALTERGRRRSLFWQVGVPYLKAKADAYYHSLLNTSPLSSHSAIPPSNDVDEEAAPSANQSRLNRNVLSLSFVVDVRNDAHAPPRPGPGVINPVGFRSERVSFVMESHRFKFMEWLQSDMNLRGRPNATGGVFKETSSLPPPPPPTQPALTHSAISLSSETRRCGLCRRPRTNPASCVSGFVFCYPCIHSYVQDHGACPVTRLPCHVSSISRIYEEDTADA
ncbi:hypothetical protein DYB35_012286 [Aphanomyces astaci]|uniref:Peroxin-12 n=1 Tax=Aphanomyces astaci TaxID=112090 RepID=A0A3R6WGV9_APHAT|nr:hypothetical protein DYB35_012286 [Aphanomyces astaci]